ncbi:FAD-binding protein [bacterium]|nr:FAD-binding protein [bacterium]
MIRRNGPQAWKNIHVTEKAELDDLVDIDNSASGNVQPTGFALLKQAAKDIDALIQEAKLSGKRIRALGSGWALTDIAITDGWLLNMKMLNGCFDISNRYFEESYPEEKQPYVVVAQSGISIGELNIHLEVTATSGFGRSLKTAGIGAGQTIAGAISGSTHGSAVNFGAIQDFVVGLQIVTGSGKSIWIERASHPVLNDEFMSKLDTRRIRDDDVFNAAVVSFGAFGVITAVAIETDPIYQLKFPPVTDITHDALKHKLNNFDSNDPDGLYHYEFVFDPYSKKEIAMETWATKVDFEPGHPAPKPVWIARSEKGFHPGDKTPSWFFGLPFVTPGQKTALQFKQYRRLNILGDVRATPGQLFTATITYLEGYTESALGISINDAAKMIDISTDIIKHMKLPAMSQVRLVHPSPALLGFTSLSPKTAVFEFGLKNDSKFKLFEENLTKELTSAGVDYTFHWSKNSGIDSQRLIAMYGEARVEKWREARKHVFDNDSSFMRVFQNAHLIRAGLT